MQLKILNSKEKKNLLNILREQYGFYKEMDYVFLVNKKNKIYIVVRDIERLSLEKMRVNSFGIYFGELYNDSVRLSIEGSQIIGMNASKNVFLLSDEELEKWIKGQDIETEKEFKGFAIVKHKNDFYASGKTSKGKLLNYIPRARALKVLND